MNAAPRPAAPPLDAAVWLTAIVLAACFIGLMHSTGYLGSSLENSAESDLGIEEELKFQQDVGAAPLQRKLGFIGLALVGVACCFGVPHGVRINWGPVTWCLLLCLAWATLSYQWSADRTETTRELIRLFMYAFVGAALARRFDPRQLCFVLVVSLAASAATAVVFELASGNFRPWISNYRMTGTVHMNVLGRLAVLVAIAGLAYQRDPKVRFLSRTIVVAAIAVLVLTKSRTGLATLVGGVAALRLVSTSSRKMFMLGCGSLGAAGAVLLLLTFGGTWMQRQTTSAMTLGRNEDVTSLTGRLPLWQSIWNESRNRSLTGFGYGAFWLPEKTQDIGAELNWFPRHAHSAYIEVLVNLGLIGLALSVAAAAAGLIRAAQLAVTTDIVEYRILTAWLAAGLVNGVAEAAFVLPRDLGIIVSASMFALVFVHPRVAALLQESPKPSPRVAAVPSFASIISSRT